MYGLISRALHVRQLLLHFLISGVALGPGRGSQKRFRSLKCGVYVVVKVCRSSESHGLLASILCLSENLIP